MYNIIVDTHEKLAWNFDFYPQVDKVIRKHLDTGDYTIEGLENQFMIERKHNTSEIAANIGSDRVRFNKELERMINVRYTYLICEFSIEDILNFPKSSDIPKYKWKNLKITGKFILKTLYDYEKKYGITLCFCKDEAEACQKAIEICDYVYKILKE